VPAPPPAVEVIVENTELVPLLPTAIVEAPAPPEPTVIV
jgi:hypothetical protein